MAGSTTFMEVSRSSLRGFRIPFPAESEQLRIVELLDKADRLRRLRREADAKASRILPALFLKMFGEPAANPMGWPELQLSQVIGSVEAGWSAQSEARRRKPSEFGVLKVSAVTSGRFRPDERPKAVREIEEGRPIIAPMKGDLLFSRANTRELVAASCVVEENHPRLFLSDKLWRLTPRDNVASTRFLKELFWQEGIRDKFRASSSGSSGSMLNIGQQAMLRTMVPVPPYTAQLQFERHSQSIVGSLEAARRAEVDVEDLWSNLLQRAFSGQLTAKWREARMQEILSEMRHQASALNLPILGELVAAVSAGSRWRLRLVATPGVR